MKNVTRVTAVGAVLAGIAVGLATPAHADPAPGPYLATIVDGGGVKQEGSTTQWALNATCGPDCVSLQTSASPVDLRRQGGVWVGSSGPCTWSMEDVSLTLNRQCPDQPTIVIGLTKL